jgi:hypothetical protein
MSKLLKTDQSLLSHVSPPDSDLRLRGPTVNQTPSTSTLGSNKILAEESLGTHGEMIEYLENHMSYISTYISKLEGSSRTSTLKEDLGNSKSALVHSKLELHNGSPSKMDANDLL